MGPKLVIVGIAAVLLGASVASATPPPGRGKPSTAGQPASTHAKKPSKTGPGCKPAVVVALRGTLTSVPGTATLPFTLQLTVKGSNAHGKAWKTAGAASLSLTSATKVARLGSKSASSLVAGDWAVVSARVCKADLAHGAMPELTATRVVAHPAKA